MAGLLAIVHWAQSGTVEPGEPAPEVLEAERAAQELAGRRVPPRTGFRMNPKQRTAIELRAMQVATEYYRRHGGAVSDVSRTKPYDLDVRLGGVHFTVEVKGTAGDGKENLLTRGEVAHHVNAQPHNALVVVSQIRLEGSSEEPRATGGEMIVVTPWVVDEESLTPLSYRYAVALAD